MTAWTVGPVSCGGETTQGRDLGNGDGVKVSLDTALKIGALILAAGGIMGRQEIRENQSEKDRVELRAAIVQLTSTVGTQTTEIKLLQDAVEREEGLLTGPTKRVR